MTVPQFNPGDPLHRITADAWNELGRGVNDYNATRSIRGKPQRPKRNPGIVRVKNMTGGARERFDIVGYGGLVFDPTDPDDPEPLLIEQTPLIAEPPSYGFPWAVLLEPMADSEDAIAEAQIYGQCWARVDLKALYWFCFLPLFGPLDGEFHLGFNPVGHGIALHAGTDVTAESEGVKPIPIEIGRPGGAYMFGKSDALIDEFTPGTVSVYSGSDDTEFDLNVECPFGTVAAANRPVRAEWDLINQVWKIGSGPCN